MKKIYIYDTTLRDGAQTQGISFSVEDKLKILYALDDMGVDYVEAGNPGSNPKDLEFFKRTSEQKLKNAKLVAFGSTRRANIKPEEDQNLNSLLRADTQYVAIFGKTWDFHVTEILKTTLSENLNMIYDSITYLLQQGKKVIYDAEHFFDGYKENKSYAMETIQKAYQAGARSICLCDTKGSLMPWEAEDVVSQISKMYGDVEIGIHCHNDNGMAAACSVSAVRSGAGVVQGTANGYGERCGNANLFTIIPNLQKFLDYRCIPDEKIEMLTAVSRQIGEISNMVFDERAPFVGNSAFTHKAGMHSDAVIKNSKAYELLDPASVGNNRNILMSEVAGRTAVMNLISKVAPELDRSSGETTVIINRLKELEHMGYQYEGAESSFELEIRKTLNKYTPFFHLGEFKVVVNGAKTQGIDSMAMIQIDVDGQMEITADKGYGPVNALDKALRKALERFYPQIKKIKLTDYKVRVLNSEDATAAKVRVLIESTDGNEIWTTVGVSEDIIEASWKALVDSIEYNLYKEK